MSVNLLIAKISPLILITQDQSLASCKRNWQPGSIGRIDGCRAHGGSTYLVHAPSSFLNQDRALNLKTCLVFAAKRLCENETDDLKNKEGGKKGIETA